MATLRRVLVTVPGGAAAASRLRGRRAVRRLLATGRFDAAWYGAQAGQGFASDADAARDYLRHGRRAGLSPNPLFEPEWYDPDTALTRADDPFTGYLGRIGEQRAVSPHLLLDPAAVIVAHPEAAAHRHGPFGWVLDHRGAGPLPVSVPGGPSGARSVSAPVPWEALQERLGEAVAVWREQDALRRAPRRSRSFDAVAERRWRAALGAQPRPSAGDAGRPVVSVVLPVRDRSGPLRRAVESVQAQTLRDWELIVVDDGSTDDTPQVLAGVCAQEPRVRVIRQDCGGVSRARNRGIAAAHGELLAFLDSDNTWRPDFLDLAVRAMRRDRLDVAYAALELRGGDGRREYRAFDGGPEHLLLGNHIDLNVLLARTELVRAVGGFAEDLRRAVDYDLVLRLAARSRPGYLPFIGAVYCADAGDRSRISVAEPLAWDFVVRSRHAVDWAAAQDGAGARVAGRVSVVVPVHDDAAAAARCVAALLATPVTSDAESPGVGVPGLGAPESGVPRDPHGVGPHGVGPPGADVEVVIADLGSRRGASVALAALAAVHPRLRVHRTPVDAGPALGVNLVLPHTTGEFVAVCHPDVLVGAGWLAPLLAQLRDPAVAAVQPLVVDSAGAIVAAGATFTAAPGQPVPLLHGHPVEDAAKLGPVVPLPGVDGPVWLTRAADLLAARGLDPLAPVRWQATDLTLRIAGDQGGTAGRLVTRVQAVLAAPVPGRAVAPPAGVNLDDGQVRRRLQTTGEIIF